MIYVWNIYLKKVYSSYHAISLNTLQVKGGG